MASINIHLAVGKVFLDKNTILNQKEFIRGILEPDLVDDKDKSHYTEEDRGTTLKEHVFSKVNLKKYLENNKIDSDYQKGVFLHLYTDYEFFHSFFDEAFLESHTYEDFCKDLYYSYVVTNEVLDEKYLIEIEEEYKEKIKNNIKKDLDEKKCEVKEYTNILPFEKLIPWIQKTGSVNLELEKDKWLK